MLKKNDKIAVAFRRTYVKDLELLIPIKLITGISDEKNSIFEDCLSGMTYVNSDLLRFSDLEETFNLVYTIGELKALYNDTDIKTIVKNHIKKIKENVYYYDENSVLLNSMPMDLFNKKFNVVVKYPDLEKYKHALILYLRGETEEIDAFFDAMEQNNSDEMEKIDEKDIQMFGEMDNSYGTKNLSKFNPGKISDTVENIKKSIISQDEPIKRITTAIYRNNMFDNPKMKSNIFIYGPTGVGKTAIVKLLAEKFCLPVSIEDMTRYTVTGYKGASVENMLVKLFYNASGNLEVAQKSVLVLDEIDKKASNGNSDSSVVTDGVLTSLLKIIEGETFDIEVSDSKTISFDTSKLTIIVCGAFSDIYKEKEEKNIGFNIIKEPKIISQELETKDFVKYGMPIEFMGRFDTIIRMNGLNEEDFINILKNSDISPLKTYVEALKNIGVDISANEEIYSLIAKKAMKYNTGARALKVVVDEMFEEILYGVFDNPKNNLNLEINGEVVQNNKSFKLKNKELSVN